MIKFIKYTGEAPNYCRGVLILEIDGKITKFGYDSDCDYEPFWEMGGAWNNAGYGERNKWVAETFQVDFPKELDIDKLLEVMNENVDPGCCGGCI